jgi:RNA polymerase sigma-70 factor (ECF subfamily)
MPIDDRDGDADDLPVRRPRDPQASDLIRPRHPAGIDHRPLRRRKLQEAQMPASNSLQSSTLGAGTPGGTTNGTRIALDDRRGSASAQSKAWLSALRGQGVEREEAVAELHGLLLRASRFELSRRQAALSHVRSEELDDIAMQAADDALVAVLAKLDDFRGASRFTTWAYKFALLEAGVRLRRRAWQGREVLLDPDSWIGFADGSISAHEELEQTELLDTLRVAIGRSLTPHQRQVFVALALNEVPIDVLAERLDSNRGALYKALHDARRNLRNELAKSGHERPGQDPPAKRLQ